MASTTLLAELFDDLKLLDHAAVHGRVVADRSVSVPIALSDL